MNGLSDDIVVDTVLTDIEMSLEMAEQCDGAARKQLLQGATLDCLKLVCAIDE